MIGQMMFSKKCCRMKRFFNVIAVAAVLVSALSCNNVSVNIEEPVSDNDRIVDFTTTPITKTVFGDLSGSTFPTLWTTAKNVAVSLNYGTAKESTAPSSTDGGATASFSVALADDESGSYKCVAISPFNAIVSTTSFNGSYKDVKIAIESDQTPSATSVDEDDQILAGFHNAGASFPSNVTMDFAHVTAYGLLSFINLGLTGGEKVASVSLTSSTLNLAGQFYYYFEDYSTNKAGDVVATAGVKTINITTNSESNIWFACAPVEIGGTDLDIVITTDAGTTFSKTVSFPAGRKFQSGHVAKFKVDMDGIAGVGATVYSLVTDVSSLTLDSEVLIVHNSEDYAAGALGGNSFMPACSIIKDGSSINSPGASVEIFKIANGNIPGTYALKCTSDDNKYLAIKSGTSVQCASTLTDEGSWAITITGAGLAKIRNMSDTDRYILSNSNSSNRFSTYTVGAVYNDVSIYKNSSTGSGAITAKVATGLSVSGMTTTFMKDDPFTFDGTVSITYSDLSEGIIVSGYTVDDSAVNTGVAGTYTVNVTYDADSENIKTSYEVTVVASSAYTWTLAGSDLSDPNPGYATSVNKGVPARVWTVLFTWKASAYFGTNEKGVQIGSSGNPVRTVVLTNSTFGSIPITKVRVNASQASSGAGTVTVSVGGNDYTCNRSTALTTSATDYTFTGSSTGNIVITISETKDKAVYLKSIGINED